MRVSIKIKSAFFLGLLLMLALAILSFIVLEDIAANQQQRYENLLYQQSKIANLSVQQSYASEYDANAEAFLIRKGYLVARQIGQLIGTHVVLYDMQGKEVGNSTPGINNIDYADVMPYVLKGKRGYQSSGETLHYLAPIIVSEKQVGVVQIYYSLKEDLAFYENTKRVFISIGSIIFILSFILGYYYFNGMTSSILRLKQAADNIKQGRYQDIPEIKRKDELGDLRQGIYYMSSQIENSIDEMQQEQRKLKLAVEKLKALDQQQRQFIGNVTHEFKTPLTVIKAYLDLTEMYPEDSKLAQDAKESIAKETQRLHEMVEKTLQLAALEKYEFESEMEAVQLDELLEDICGRMEGKLQKHGLRLDKEIQPAVIWADRESLFQIFINLLDNAIKYNVQNGKIAVKAYEVDGYINIEIVDTGIGIPVEVRDKVFEPFYRVDKDRARQTGGIGLGLALVKQLVEKQVGRISIMDNEEQGTTFLIQFPRME